MSARTGTVGSAVLWSGGGGMAMRLGQLLIGIAVARIMTPYDFGVFAVTLAVYALIVNVSEVGIGSALIRSRGSIDRLAPTAVTLSMASSAVLGTAMWFAAPLVASLMRTPDAAEAIQVMSLVVVMAGVSSVPLALITRNFRQDRKFIADAASFVVGNSLLIVFALSGMGVMAFAWSRVAAQIVTVILLLILTPERYLPGFRVVAARTLFRFGAPFVAANLVGYGVGNVDAIVIGRILGAVPLGSYTLANNVAGWPLGMFTSVLTSVGLPVLSRISHSAEMLRGYLSNAMSMLGGVFFYMTAMCAALAQPLVDALYGPKWAAAGSVLAVLAVYGSTRVLLALFSDALIACNRPRSLLIVQFAWLIALIPGMTAGALIGGLVGAAVAQVVISLLVPLPLSLLLLRLASGVRVLPILKMGLLPLLAASLSGAAAHAVALAWPNPWLALIFGGSVGTLVYGALMFRLLARTRTEVKSLYGGGVTHFTPTKDSSQSSPSPSPSPSPSSLNEEAHEDKE
ncbi:MAG: lipopolysaccharide biosynthesis protein [Cryobacterium sp.]|nr:lipopolysaccharide biosynthesis protein [Cryobacterium sp.]